MTFTTAMPHLAPLITSFVLIFLAELGDKTLYTVLILAARNRALPVLIGAWAAFLVQSLIAIALGSLLSLLPAGWVRWITASVFLGFGLLLLLKKDPADPADLSPGPRSRVLLTTFLLVFAAEWGDATQVGTAALIARFREPLQVFIGATLGLWLGAALAVAVGRTLGSRLPARLLRRTAGILFCLFAIVAAIKMP